MPRAIRTGYLTQQRDLNLGIVTATLALSGMAPPYLGARVARVVMLINTAGGGGGGTYDLDLRTEDGNTTLWRADAVDPNGPANTELVNSSGNGVGCDENDLELSVTENGTITTGVIVDINVIWV